MSLESKTRVIEGLNVTCTQLPALKAYSVFARLSKAIGPAITELSGVDFTKVEVVEDADGVESVEGLNIADLAPALSKFLEGIAEDEALALALLATVTVRRGGMNIDLLDDVSINTAFAGKFKAMLLTLKFCLEVNFSDFLGDGLAALAKAKAKAEETKEEEKE